MHKQEFQSRSAAARNRLRLALKVGDGMWGGREEKDESTKDAEYIRYPKIGYAGRAESFPANSSAHFLNKTCLPSESGTPGRGGIAVSVRQRGSSIVKTHIRGAWTRCRG